VRNGFFRLFMQQSRLSWLALLACWPVFSNGQETAWDQLANNLMTGTLEFRAYAYDSIHELDDVRYPVELLLNQELALDFSANWSFVGSLQYRVDNRHFTSGIIDEWNEESPRRFHLNLPEAYVRWSGERTDITLGKRIFAWGKADGFNPADNLNPYDYLDFLTAEKMGIMSLAWSYSGSMSGIDLVFVPMLTPSRIPEGDNRWQIMVPFSDFPQNTLFHIADRELPSRTIQNSQFAFRFWATFAGLDLDLTAYKGFDPIPAVDFSPPNLISPPHLFGITFTPVFNKIEEYSLALSRAFGGTSIHLESSYRITADRFDDDFLSYVLGLNHSFYVGTFIEEIRVIAEFIDETWIHEKQSDERVTTLLSRPLRDTAMLNLDVRFTESNHLEVTTAYNLKQKDYALQTSFKYGFSDAFKVRLGVDLLHGKPGTFWGNWSQNDRAFLELQYFF